MHLQSMEEIAARAASTLPAEHLAFAIRMLTEAEAALNGGNLRHVRLLLRSLDTTLRSAQRKLDAASALAAPAVPAPAACTESGLGEPEAAGEGPGRVVDLAAVDRAA